MPIAVPTIPHSDSGVSKQRSGPNSSCRPAVARNTPPRLPTSSPNTHTRSSLRISVRRPSVTASIRVIVAMGNPAFRGAPTRSQREGAFLFLALFAEREQLAALLFELRREVLVHVLEQRV